MTIGGATGLAGSEARLGNPVGSYVRRPKPAVPSPKEEVRWK